MTDGLILITVLTAALLLMIALFLRYIRLGYRAEREVRDAMLNHEELQRHASEVASTHSVSIKAKSSRRVLPRMEDNYKFIIKTYKILNEDLKNKKTVVPAAEWLFDNFYVIEEQVKEIRLNFPKGYYGALPRLNDGKLRGFPRLYAIALEIVSHTDGSVDEKVIVDFINSYQSKSNLTSGELWALPMMVRIALIENIRRICEEILNSRQEREKADMLADSIIGEDEFIAEDAGEKIDAAVKDMEDVNPVFFEQLLKRLRRHGSDIGPVIHHIDMVLSYRDTTAESVIAREHQAQARGQISIGNSITSLRLVASLNWNELFEKLSPVEQILSQDSIYASMDFGSRDYYRHEIELMARSLRVPETVLAKKAIECGVNAGGSDDRNVHVGYYLVGKGRAGFESMVGYRPGIYHKLGRFVKKYPSTVYIFSIAIVTLLLTFIFGYYAYRVDPNRALISGLLVLLPSSEISVGIVNWMVTHTVKPGFLPKIEFKDGIPEEAASIVVIPTLFPNCERVRELIGQLEVYYLANRDKNLFFALLGDFTDAKSQNMPGDGEIVNCALEGIKRLNRKYSRDRDIFYLFHRYRKFNLAQDTWMGWERKRGKLVEFGQLLRGSQNTTYYIKSGDISKLPEIKYMITLDADTELPMGIAKKLIGTIYHPLNKAVLDERKQSVVDGYGILQPRISIGITSANKTRFSRIFGGQTGLDPYTSAVSDVYQDLFGEGIYTGKGIIDIDVFLKILDGTIPENRVLSHDLLEGAYTRAGLVTDIELVDGFPSKYNSYAARLHRWVRGDWQLIPWLLPVVKNSSGQNVKNPLSAISRFKIFDNLRRSLISPSLMVLIVLTFCYLPGDSLVWLFIGMSAIAFPIFADVADAVIMKGRSSRGSCFSISEFLCIIYQITLMIVFLPYQAYIMVDAAARSITRLFFTKKKLLEWETAADVENRLKNDRKGFFTSMWISPVSAAVLFVLVLTFSPPMWGASLPYIIIWILSPSIAYWLSRNMDEKKQYLNEDERLELRRLSRKTWRYFEEFAGAKDNFLPPDNFQEEPPNGAAHRTSPTNIGLLLVSTLCARDMGYLTTTGMLEKLEKCFSSIEKLNTWKGHLYNWYDTVTLQPLRPLYVSTVDSGNFAGYLMVLREGLDEYLNRPLIDIALAQGLTDTIKLLNEDLKEEERMGTAFLEKYISDKQFDIVTWRQLLNTAYESVNSIETDSPWKSKALEMLCSFSNELMAVFPWIDEQSNMPDSVKTGLNGVMSKLKRGGSIMDLSEGCREAMNDINSLAGSLNGEDQKMLREFKAVIMKSYLSLNSIKSRMKSIMKKCTDTFECMDFKPLFDERRQLFSIGYSAEDEQLNRSFYDLLASESRQTSLIAIAKGDVNAEHWFRLGRPLTAARGMKGLVSWSGTMFEYLMPLLIMKNYENTLMDKTYGFVMKAQMEYGSKRHVPWGVSESGYNTFDILFNYQYRAFGVPLLGLKRGLVKDMVVAPYAAILALMVDQESSLKNLHALKEEGLDGPYGMYEAIDYTPERLPVGKKSVIIKSFMVHHEGMSMLALNNVLNENVMQERFHRSPLIKSVELLLQERVPNRVVLTKDIEEEISPLEEDERDVEEFYRVIKNPVTNVPEVNMISNGRYHVVLTNSGSGYSKRGDYAVTRWREERNTASFGMFFYIQNINSNNVWSAAYEPYRKMPEDYSVVFTSDKVEYHRVDGSIDTHTEIVVSPEDDAEIRRISLTNHSDHARIIEVTSYCEIVAAPQSADVAHRTFSNLFIKTEFVHGIDTLLAGRRPRTEGQGTVWLFHTCAVEGETIGPVQYETDRMKFIGRNRDLSDPEAMDVDHPLSNSIGAVLDPIFSMRIRVRVETGKTVRLSFATGMCESREKVMETAQKYHDLSGSRRAFELAWSRSQVEARYLSLKKGEVETYQRALSHIIYSSPLRKGLEDKIKTNTKGQSGLWPFGISGDIPVLLVSIKRSDEVDIIYEALKFHEYLRLKGFKLDLVILNEDKGDYIQSLQNQIKNIISSSHGSDIQDRPGGVFLRQAGNMTSEERTLLYTVSRLVLKGEDGGIGKQIKLAVDEEARERNVVQRRISHIYPDADDSLKSTLYFNGIGGFKEDGSEYIIQFSGKARTPAPWINVVSNRNFGFIATEYGSGYTWAENSREFKLSPWSNDPVTDPPGEIIYLRDEEDGEVWTVTPGPIREEGRYIIRHGFGYTSYEHGSHGIKHEETLFVPVLDNIKIYKLKLKNISGKPRHISAFLYVSPVLGVSEAITSPFIVSSIDKDTGIMLLKNTYTDDFPDRVVFLDSTEEERSITGDREEFIGRDGSLEKPDALRLRNLSGKTGAGFNPCGAVKVSVELEPGEEREFAFTLGEGKNESEAVNTALKYRDMGYIKNSYREVVEHWMSILGAIRVKTPDASLDLLTNGWLLYQVISCRIYARSAFYQSGGAYGFRDQLQDVMAAVYVSPDMTREQILESSSHQFLEGDVQHWWHPVTDRGIRTRFSDDLLWLPYVCQDYIESTGDIGILDVKTRYLEDEPLKEGEDERYNKPKISEREGTIYEHCIRSIDRSLELGVHGIPLMGSGDWNDGMSTVGNKGKGESVWLGWFLYSILKRFSSICRDRGDDERAERYKKHGEEIAANIEKNGWDGSWYRRAYFDSGLPLGSASNMECRIDSIAQSWSAISGGGKEYRVLEAMGALEQYLVRKDTGIILLLTPPFDNSDLEPGYIKSYVPGVRENGGQYTHAAVWVILAFAKLGMGDKAWQYFNMINPVNHSNTTMEAWKYKVEPYVMAADVYAVEPHVGRGGWTWYTGAAGWMYRVCIEHMLGLKVRGDKLIIDPCIPSGWKEYMINYRVNGSQYTINIKNPKGVNTGVQSIYLDGVLMKDGIIPLERDEKHHIADVTLG